MNKTIFVGNNIEARCYKVKDFLLSAIHLQEKELPIEKLWVKGRILAISFGRIAVIFDEPIPKGLTRQALFNKQDVRLIT